MFCLNVWYSSFSFCNSIEDGEYLDMSYEKERKTELMKRGFSDWTEVDFDQFCEAMYTFGRRNLVEIAKCVKQKTLDEVVKYHAEFWARGRAIFGEDDFHEISKKVERANKLLAQKLKPIVLQPNVPSETVVSKPSNMLQPIQFNQSALSMPKLPPTVSQSSGFKSIWVLKPASQPTGHDRSLDSKTKPAWRQSTLVFQRVPLQPSSNANSNHTSLSAVPAKEKTSSESGISLTAPAQTQNILTHPKKEM